ncbi:MAG: GLPGLI family protein [Arachidicoccus sp.]|nr:GLPGLI family protein [Arachidicoccus sp.]
MKTKISFLIAICISLFSKYSVAQTNVQVKFNNTNTELTDTQQVVCKVVYNMQFVPDTTRKDSMVNELFELDLAKTSSMFTSFTKHLRDSAMQNEIKEQMKQYIGADGKFNTDGKPVKFDFSNLSAKFPSITSDKLFTTSNNGGAVLSLQTLAESNFLIKDTVEKINWQIQDSTKTIQGNLCQKAVGESHGRIYTVWFCSDIPYSFGPRRLYGLPGLILEARDNKNEVIYTLQSINNSVLNEKIGLPKDGIYTTPQEFNKAKDAYDKNPEAFMQSHNTNPNVKVFKVVSGRPAPGAKVSGLIIKKANNKIDLK